MTRRPCGHSPPPDIWFFQMLNKIVCLSLHLTVRERCSQCAEDHNWATCTATENKCPNCRGNHSANDRSCPRYKCEEKVLKIKSTNNITYAEIVEETCREAVFDTHLRCCLTASAYVILFSDFILRTLLTFKPWTWTIICWVVTSTIGTSTLCSCARSPVMLLSTLGTPFLYSEMQRDQNGCT